MAFECHEVGRCLVLLEARPFWLSRQWELASMPASPRKATKFGSAFGPRRAETCISPWMFLSPLPCSVGFLCMAHLCTESANALVNNLSYLGSRTTPLRLGVLQCKGGMLRL